MQAVAAPTQGTFSNPGDWLFYALCNTRGAKLAMACQQNERDGFTRDFISALQRYATLPLSSRPISVVCLGLAENFANALADATVIYIKGRRDGGTARIVPFKMVTLHGTRTTNTLPLFIGIKLDGRMPIDFAIGPYCDYNPVSPRYVPPLVAAVPRVEPMAEEEEEENKVLIAADESIAAAALVREFVILDARPAIPPWVPECPVCDEVPYLPWRTYVCGHQYCADCHAKLPLPKLCPECRAANTSSLVHQYKLMKAAECNELILPCRNEECTAAVPYDAMEAHLSVCAHRMLDCQARAMVGSSSPKCEWKGSRASMASHLLKAHPVVVVDDPERFEITWSKGMEILYYWKPRKLLIAAGIVINGTANTRVYSLFNIIASTFTADPQTIHITTLSGKEEATGFAGSCVFNAQPIGVAHYITMGHIYVPFRIGSSMSVQVIVMDKEEKKRAREEEEEEVMLPPAKVARILEKSV
jgi:hypothetical protein